MNRLTPSVLPDESPHSLRAVPLPNPQLLTKFSWKEMTMGNGLSLPVVSQRKGFPSRPGPARPDPT